MPDYPNIDRYYADLAELIELGGSDNELNIRPAFQNCLTAYCAAHREKLRLVPERPTPDGVRPDGTVLDALRMPRGFWEAKDVHDDLDAEIQASSARGIRRDNILFETPGSPYCSRTVQRRCGWTWPTPPGCTGS